MTPRADPNARQIYTIYGTAIGLTVLAAVAADTTSLGLLAPVGVAVFVGLLLLIWTRPQSLLWMVVVGFAIQPDLKFFISPDFGPAKDVFAIAAILVTIAYVWDGRRRRALTCDPWIVAAFCAVLVLYFIDVNGGHSGNWINAVRPVIEAFGLFFAGYVLLRFDGAWQTCVKAVLAMGLIEAIAGIAEQAVGQNFLAYTLGFPYNAVLTTVNGLPRSFGTQIDPFNYAAMIALSIPFAMFAIRSRRRRWLCLVILFAGLASGLIRTSLVVALVLVIIGLLHGRRGTSVGFLIAAIVIGGGGYFISSQTSNAGPSTTATLNGRTAEWSRVEHPQILLVGAGVGNLGSGVNRSLQGGIYSVGTQSSDVQAPINTNANATSIDSSYLALIADIGLPGLLLVLAGFARIVGVAIRANRAGSNTGVILIGMILVLGIDGLTRSSLTQFPFGHIALLVIGTTVAAAERAIAASARLADHPGEVQVGYDLNPAPA